MLKTLTYEIPSCDDIELDIKRESKLHFKITFDDEKEIKALLFFIPGLGEDMSASYREHLAEFVAKEYPVAVVGVDYFCVGNRPQVGCSLCFDEIDTLILKTTLKNLNLKFDEEMLKNSTVSEVFIKIDLELAKMKENKMIKEDSRLIFTTTMIPKRNEYNNFGIMSATDIINALLFIKANLPFKAIGGGGFAYFYVWLISWGISRTFVCENKSLECSSDY